MPTSLALLKDLAPEFKLLGDAALSRALARAAVQINSEQYDALYQEAACNLAAHLLTVAQRGQSVGGQQPNEAAPFVAAAYMNKSKYLDEFERLSKMVFGSPIVITS